MNASEQATRHRLWCALEEVFDAFPNALSERIVKAFAERYVEQIEEQLPPRRAEARESGRRPVAMPVTSPPQFVRLLHLKVTGITIIPADEIRSVWGKGLGVCIVTKHGGIYEAQGTIDEWCELLGAETVSEKPTSPG
jgi:hypothetical protein